MTAAWLAALFLPVPALATGLVDNVNGIAPDAQGRLVRFTGLLIDDAGRVERRLSASDKRPGKRVPLTFRLDAGGRTLIPGFVDAGMELMPYGLTLVTLDLSDTRSIDEALAKISAFRAANPGRKWILGRGWDSARWGVDAPPTAAELDAATGDVPTWLESADGDQGWANSAALRAATIGPRTLAPPGGRITPTGILSGAAMALMRVVTPAPAPRDYDYALEQAQRALLARGVTTVTDLGTTLDAWQAYRRAGDRSGLRLRIIGYAQGVNAMVAIAGPEPTPWLYDARLRLAGIQLTLDGGLAARGAWLKSDYADAPGEKGLPIRYDTSLRNLMSRAAMDGFQIALTAHGDMAVREALDAFDEMAQTYGKRRWRIDSVAQIDPLDAPRFASNGIGMTRSPTDDADRAMRNRRLGAERAVAGVSLPFAVTSSTPARPPAPFAQLSTVMTDPLAPLPLDRALAAMTRAGALVAGEEGRIGGLEPGQMADFLLIDRDISTLPPAQIGGTRVLESWIGGKRVYVAAGASPAAPSAR